MILLNLFVIKEILLFLNITDIKQQGLTNSVLAANDGLHTSKEASLNLQNDF